jgi:hypothetical protein
MAQMIQDVHGDLEYYRLLEASEQGRWDFADLPWGGLDEKKVTPTLIHNAKAAAYGELTTFSATEAFMKLFREDVDFTQWLAVWFYEETKHPLALIKWLAQLGVPTDETFIHRGREITPMTKSRSEMLTFNIISEISACNMYNFLRETTDEPLFVEITRNLARDEMRHSVGFTHYCAKTIERAEDPDQERLRVLRATWFMTQPSRDDLTRHPVLLTLQQTQGVQTDELLDRINTQIVTRIGRMLDLDIPKPEAVYDAYAGLKKSYRGRQAVPALA